MARANAQVAMRISLITILGNVLLTVFKLLAGIVGHSAAMISDAIHSLSDVFSTFIVIVGITMANKEADHDHPYGHERFECVAAIILAVILFATGIGIGYHGVMNVVAGNYAALTVPGLIALTAALVSIVVKEAMYWYTRHGAKKINSGALMADAWHHRSDALSSVGSFIGILGARIGFPVMDSLASILICLFIVKAAYDIFRDAIGKMTDKSCDAQTELAIRQLVLEQVGVNEVFLLHTRLFGDKIYVDVRIRVDGNAPLCESHVIAHRVHDAIEAAYPAVKHCMVYLHP